MRYPIVLDLETKHSFREFAEHKKLGISVVGIFDYKTQKLEAFFENELNKLFPILENASRIIGFNLDSFDMPVLQAYYPGRIEQFKTFDILEDIRSLLGHRLALNDLVSATLDKKKSGHGLAAIDMYREGRFEELKNYCLDDVFLTKELFEFGVQNNKVNFMDSKGKAALRVNWGKYTKDDSTHDVSLTLPF